MDQFERAARRAGYKVVPMVLYHKGVISDRGFQYGYPLNITGKDLRLDFQMYATEAEAWQACCVDMEIYPSEEDQEIGNLAIPPEQWLKEQFEFEYCEYCGGDAIHHTAVPFMGNWFARCEYPVCPSGELHHEIRAYRERE